MKIFKFFAISTLMVLSMSLSAQLQVLSSGDVYLPSGKSYWIGASSDNGNRLRMHQVGTAAYMDYYNTLYLRTGGSLMHNVMTLGSNGSVAINAYGITNYGSALNVLVNTQYSCAYHLKNNYYGGSDVFYVRGDGYVWTRNGFLTSSDKKFKTDISKIDSPLESIKKMNGVKYKRKFDIAVGESFSNSTMSEGNDSIPSSNMITEEKVDDKYEFGLIAQDVEKILPEIVHTMHDNSKAVNYIEIIPFLIEAVKEQQDQIEKQQSQIEELKRLVNK